MAQAALDFEQSYQVGNRAFSRDPVARASDPETSKQAGAEIVHKISDLHAKVVGIARRYGPMTANEIGCKTAEVYAGTGSMGKVNPETARKRVRECERMGFLIEGEPRECSVTGKKAATYKAKG